MSEGLAHFRFIINDYRYDVASATGWQSVLDTAVGAYYTHVGAVAGKWVRSTGALELQGTEGLFEVYRIRTTRNDYVTVRVRQIGVGTGGDEHGVRVGR